jgi:peptidyl-prolyl cis-trans isomerase C
VLRLIPLILVIALAACNRSAPGETPAGDSTGTQSLTPTDLPPGAAMTAGPEAAPVPAELPAIVARVNGEEIRKADFEKALRNLERRAGSPVPASERDRIYRQVLEELIAYRVLLQESRSRKVDVPDADVEARLGSVRQQFPTEEAFTTMLSQQSLTLDQARAEMRDELRVAKLLEAEIAPKISVQPNDVTNFYKQNPTEFEQPELVRASHILISAPANADAAARTSARQKAAGVLKRAKGGEDFAALAREFSQDPGSAANGGELGLFTQGDMVGPFNDAAFTLPVGAISDLVETEFGFHIIKVLEKQAARAVPLDEARPAIERHLQDRNRLQHTQEFVQGLVKKGSINILF